MNWIWKKDSKIPNYTILRSLIQKSEHKYLTPTSKPITVKNIEVKGDFHTLAIPGIIPMTRVMEPILATARVCFRKSLKSKLALIIFFCNSSASSWRICTDKSTKNCIKICSFKKTRNRAHSNLQLLEPSQQKTEHLPFLRCVQPCDWGRKVQDPPFALPVLQAWLAFLIPAITQLLNTKYKWNICTENLFFSTSSVPNEKKNHQKIALRNNQQLLSQVYISCSNKNYFIHAFFSKGI